MVTPALQTLIGAADAYESLMVPALFSAWAPIVADAADVRAGDHVLDVACGTGVLAREAATRVGTAGRVAAIDPGVGMLAVAKRLAPAIDWYQGVAESLPFPDASFDAVVSQFGLMFFANRGAAIRETLRVLKPDGRIAVAVWDSLEADPAYAAVVDVLDRAAGRDAADALRAPFVLGDRDAFGALFRDNGARSVDVKTLRAPAAFPSARVMVEADLRGWLPLRGIVLSEDQIAHILDEAERALAAFVAPDGRAVFDTSAHIVTARR